MRSRSLALLVGLLGVACKPEPRVVTIELTTGHEQGVLLEDPAVTRVDISALDVDGAVISTATGVPGGTFQLGEVELDRFVSFAASGTDAAGVLRARGRSIGLVVGDLAADLLPVFVQRLDRMARPPGELARTHCDGLAATVGERFLMLTGGVALAASGSETDAAAATFYDLLSLGAASGGVMPRVARSAVVGADGESVLLVDDEGASWVRFDDGTVTEAALPAGLASFADVAGGRAISGPEATYLVGPTRADQPSDRVLVVGADGSLAAVATTASRRGAAAAWVDPVGLVVVGGSSTAAGIETLAGSASAFVPRPFPSDPTEGAAAISEGGGSGVLVGGTLGAAPAPVRVFDAACGAATCPFDERSDLDLGYALTRCRGFALGGGRMLVVGEQDDGQTRAVALLLTGGTTEELPLREPRRGAAVVATPLGSLAILGGAHLDGTPALTVESFMPE